MKKSAASAFGLTIATAGLLIAGCAPAPGSPTEQNTDAATDLVPCMVSDTGGYDDKSFNQAGLAGITAAADALGVEPITVESATETDFAPNIDQLIGNGCGLIVSVGFLLADATKAAAEANPGTDFAIIDDASISAENVKPITFETSQASFLAGYAAASYSRSGIVGTYGGVQIPPVTIFMDGFVAGVDYFNEQNDADVRALGWDATTQTGTFTGSFAAGVEAKTAAQGLIDQGADVLLPVGPIFSSAGEAIRDSGDDIALVGVDSDNYVTAPDLKDLFLTSVTKGVTAGTEDVVTAAAQGEFSAEPYVGTLKNEGVGIAPFHDFESKVDPDLAAQLDEITQGIIDGSIVVDSPSSLVD